MEAVAVGIHGYHSDKIARLKVPHGLWYAEFFQQVHAVDCCNLVRIVLGCSTDGIQVNGANLLQRSQSPGAHSTLSDNCSDAKLPENVRLIWLFANRSGRSGGLHVPSAVFV